MLRCVPLGNAADASAATIDLRGASHHHLQGEENWDVAPHGGACVAEAGGPVSLHAAHVTWSWVCDGARLRLSVFVPHAALPEPHAVDVLFPSCIAPSPVAIQQQTTAGISLHVLLTDGALYRLDFELPLTDLSPSCARHVTDVEGPVAAVTGDGSVLVYAAADGTIRRLRQLTQESYDIDTLWQAGVFSRFLGFVPGLGKTNAGPAAAAAVSQLCTAVDDAASVTYTAALTAGGRLRFFASSAAGKTTVMLDTPADALLLQASVSSQVAEPEPETMEATGLRPCAIALQLVEAEDGSGHLDALLALFSRGSVALFFLPLAEVLHLAQARSSGNRDGGMTVEPRFVAVKTGLPPAVRDLRLSASQVVALFEEDGVPTAAVATFAARPGPRAAAAADPRPWQPVLPRVDLHARPSVPANLDPRSVYSAYLFAPGRFRAQSLRRALADISHTPHAPHVAAGPPLEREITLAVEQLICAATLELAPEEYRSKELSCWKELLETVTQHEAQTSAPVALASASGRSFLLVTPAGPELMLPCGGLERVYARHDTTQCDLPAAVLGDATSARDIIKLLSASRSVGELLGDVMEADWHLRPLDTALDMATAVLDGSLLMSDASGGAQQEADEDGDVVDVAQNLWGMLSTIRDLPTAARAILFVLDGPEEEYTEKPADLLRVAGANGRFDVNRLAPCFGRGGIAAVVSRVHQLTALRATLARDVLVTLVVATRLQHRADLRLEETAALEALMPAFASHCGIYRRLAWLGEHTTPQGRSILEEVAEALGMECAQGAFAMLEPWMISCEALPLDLAAVLHTSSQRLLSYLRADAIGALAALPLPFEGVIAGSLLLTHREALLVHLDTQLYSLDAHSAIAQVAPRGGNTSSIFALGRNAAAPTPVRDYFVGCALLSCGQVREARSRLDKVARSFARLTILRKADIVGDERASLERQFTVVSAIVRVPHNQPLNLCYFFHHLVQLFEGSLPDALFVAPELDKPSLFKRQTAVYCILELTQAALSEYGLGSDKHAREPQPLETALWTMRFKYALNLGMVDLAFTAMTSLPREELRRDCLQKLVTVLCERGDAQSVVELPYGELQSDVLQSLESRARTGDALEAVLGHHTNFYELLYAFYLFRGDFRSAGQSMLDLALRLSIEHFSSDDERAVISLESERDAYLAAINALQLLDPADAWLTGPTAGGKTTNAARRRRRATASDDASDDDEIDESSAAHSGSSTLVDPNGVRRQGHLPAAPQMLTTKEIERRYVLVQARLDVLEARLPGYKVAGPSLTPEEAVAVLVEGGRFDDAVSLALTTLSRTRALVQLEAILERLTEECLRLELEDRPPVGWLQLNDVGPRERLSPANCGWLLLRSLLCKYDGAETNFRLRRVVTERILSLLPMRDGQRMPLPHWLRAHVPMATVAASHATSGPEGVAAPVPGTLTIKSAEADPTTLLRLYIKYERWDDALRLAARLVRDAGDVLDPLRKERSPDTAEETWAPYTMIDLLLGALQTAPLTSDERSSLGKQESALRKELERLQHLLVQAR